MEDWTVWQICDYLCTCMRVYQGQLVNDVVPLLLIGLMINIVLTTSLFLLILHFRDKKMMNLLGGK